MSSAPNDLVKVCVELPHHWSLKGASFWSPPLGNDRHQALRISFYDQLSRETQEPVIAALQE